MNTKYILYNEDLNEIIAESTDKSLLEEIMCDEFIYDVTYDFFSECQTDGISEKELYELAPTVWDDLINYYNNYINIYNEKDLFTD